MNPLTARLPTGDLADPAGSHNVRFLQDRPLLAILALALALRLLWALSIDVVPVSDSAAYLALAKSLAEGRGYAWADGTLTAFWPPGTSFLYGGLFWLFGQRFEPIVALNLCAGVAVVYLGFRLSRLLYGRLVGLLTAGLLAVWPLLIQFTTILASEILFLVPVLMAMLTVFETRSPKLGHFIWFGFLIAVASYIRPTATPLLVILPVLSLLRCPAWRPLAGWIGVGGLVCMALIWPWTERNSKLFGQPTSISTNFGANLWMGNNSQSRGTYQSLEQYDHLTNEKVRDDQMRADAIAYIKANPVEFMRLGLKRIVTTFDRETIGVAWNIHGIENRFANAPWMVNALKLASSGYWYVMLLAAVAGAWLLLARERWRIIGNPVIVVALFFAVVPAVMVGQDRYHVPMIPMIACCAGYFLFNLGRYKKSTA
jgi:4-amino-4-deoxy-L-arabinose transferase-like glycosyltransferase